MLYDRSLEKTFQEAQPIVEVETQGESLQQIALEVLHPLVLETGAAEYSVDSGHLWGGDVYKRQQYGSGGRDIGLALAQSLDVAFYDKELIKLAAKKSGINEKLFENADAVSYTHLS